MERVRLVPNSENFQELRLGSDVMVDKTLFIDEFLHGSGRIFLIIRPRRFGKSMNLSMLKYFFEIEVDESGHPLPEEQCQNRALFVGGTIQDADGENHALAPLKIAGCREALKKMGKHPVVDFSFKNIEYTAGIATIRKSIYENLATLYGQHTYLKNNLSKAKQKKFEAYEEQRSEGASITDSLRFLTEILHEHFGRKAYVLIDEYDALIHKVFLKYGHHSKELQEVVALCKGIMGQALKGNQYLERAVVTGILRLAKTNILSDLNNLTEDTLLDDTFSDFYGFTEEEVHELLAKVPVQTSQEAIKSWYNGYHWGGKTIYNPWSIIQCLGKKGVLDTYWINAGGTAILDPILLDDKVQQDLQLLLAGQTISKKLNLHVTLSQLKEKDRHTFYTMLLLTGYLDAEVDYTNPRVPLFHLRIPNEEVSVIFERRILSWVKGKLHIERDQGERLVDFLFEKDFEGFAAKLQSYLLASSSFHDVRQERDYHNLMGGVLTPLFNTYQVSSNIESGLGRPDHLLVPHAGKGTTAFIFEYKVADREEALGEKAKAALAQIEDQQYRSTLQGASHVESIASIGMSFYKKHMVLKAKFAKKSS